MAKPYAAEMAQLAATFDWAATVDLTPLRDAVRTAAGSPLRVIGSGGSLTCAHALAGLHQRYTGHLAAVATPLEAVDEPLHAHTAAWLLSAGGRNADILAATKALIVREPRQIAALCGRDPSPLTALCRKHPFVDLLLYPPPAGKDGFLATNSLLAFVTLLTRTYAAEFGSSTDWDDTAASVKALLRKTPAVPDSWQTATAPLWTRSTVLVLHGPATRIGAIDLESKFTEAALGHVQIADYRNFAHGRHHWLAKRGTTSAVLAFLTAPDRRLAERTLALIPPEVPQVPIVLHGGPNAAPLASLLATFWITAWAGRARRIDPGRPGVPEFGRKLYNLRPSRSRHPAHPPGLTPRAAAAIARKAGVALDRLSDPHQITLWRDALHAFIHHLRRARFAGVVLDYDGTIVDTRHRTAPARPEMTSELVRLHTAGARIAIATGRGKSVRRDLQRSLPPVLWPLVLVGYYNGAQIAPLTDDRAPDGSPQLTVALQPLASALSRPARTLRICAPRTSWVPTHPQPNPPDSSASPL